MNVGISHVGFADESNWNTGRFRSLGLVTAPFEYVEELEYQTKKILQESGIREFKWKNLRGAKKRFVAEKLCYFATKYAKSAYMRVDVLIWDIEDSRHKIFGRDDIANLERMYYHLFRNVMRARWPDYAVWKLYPDEHTAINWGTLQECLENRSITIELDRSLFTGGQFRFRLRREFGIKEIEPVSSEKCVLLQIADLFAGLAVFSYEKFKEYQIWLKDQSPQLALLSENRESVKLSNKMKERFVVLKKFDELCKYYKMGVSLRTYRGLRTPNPENPLNFWLYKPQHPEDKAPTKK